LCPVLPQVPQCLSARTLFNSPLLALQLLPTFLASKSTTSPTVRVSSFCMYRLLQLFRFAFILAAS